MNPNHQTLTLPEAMQMAVQYHQTGDLPQAEAIYRQILAVQPNHSDALHLLGLITYHAQDYEESIRLIQQAIWTNSNIANYHNSLGNVLRNQGRLNEAEECFQHALALNPNDSGFHYNLGLTLTGQSRWPDAIACYQRALTLAPQSPEILNSLGQAWRGYGQFAEAIACFQQALTLAPRLAETHNNLGVTYFDQGNLEEALKCFQRALAINSNFAEVYNNLGNLFKRQGKLPEAVDFYQRALLLIPNSAQLHYNLGNAVSEQHQWQSAIEYFQQAIALNPNLVAAYNNLGTIWEKQGKFNDATACYEHALARNPNFAEAHTNVGNILWHQGKLTEAQTSFQRALSLQPQSAAAHNDLANVLKDKGLLREAIAAYQTALELGPANAAEIHSNLLYTLHYSLDYDAATLLSAHQQYQQQHAAALSATIQPHSNEATLSRRLKIGYVSADFRQHPVAYFLEPILAHHHHASFEIFCYYNAATQDEITQRLQQYADHWLDCVELSEEALAQQIRQDNIDLLIDLSGHIANNRLLTFAQKPAPIQATYLGYPNTTGLTAIDYHITDSYVEPEGITEKFHSETVMRLPDSYYCYQPMDNSPAVNELPALSNGYVTFGSFNNLTKLNVETFRWWAEILRRVPNAKLVLITQSFGDFVTRQTVEEQLVQLGIPRTRLVLSATMSTEDTLKAYQQIDIALDSYPYNGATTTCEALWMGVPVITLVGPTPVGRVGLSLLSTLRQTELIARTPPEYCNIAVRLANNLTHLQQLRAGMRINMMSSALMNAPAFTRHLESIYLRMWQRWCLSR